MDKKYTKSILLFVHIILGAILTFFTLLAMSDYKRNVVMGLLISIVILFLYFILLKKSASFFNQGRVGVSYFLAIGGFFLLMFIQLINCTNSIALYMH